MDRRNIPVITTLVTGALSMIFSMIRNDSLLRRTVTLLIVVIIFYLLGRLLQWLLDYFDAQNEKAKQIEGEMVEKDSEGTESTNAKSVKNDTKSTKETPPEK